jgi:acyl carrier protein
VQTVLSDPEIALTKEMSANDIEDWDSLNHIQIVVAIEKKFDIRFNAAELVAYDTIGALVDAIDGKLVNKTA